MKRLLFLSLFFIFFSKSGYAAICYVTVAGGLAGDGSNWANAYAGNSLQVAINASGPGDEVWVAAGIYKTTIGIDRTISFAMKNGVAIYGSFAGTETTLSQRVLSNGLTSILSGEIGVAGIADNSYHTISNTALNNTAVIDGFIIRDANDDRSPTITEGWAEVFTTTAAVPEIVVTLLSAIVLLLITRLSLAPVFLTVVTTEVFPLPLFRIV